MKSERDEALGLLRKAENDLKMAEIGLAHEAPLDTICFHLQQVAGKLLKGLLSYRKNVYPFTHDLQELLQQVVRDFPPLLEFQTSLADFTPYAVRMRYDETVYPDENEARAALATVRRLRSVVHSLLPPEIIP